VNNDQYKSRRGHTERHPTFLNVSVIVVEDGQCQRIQEHACRLFETDAVIRHVGGSLSGIPRKSPMKIWHVNVC
jgi:hypothetical protein